MTSDCCCWWWSQVKVCRRCRSRSRLEDCTSIVRPATHLHLRYLHQKYLCLHLQLLLKEFTTLRPQTSWQLGNFFFSWSVITSTCCYVDRSCCRVLDADRLIASSISSQCCLIRVALVSSFPSPSLHFPHYSSFYDGKDAQSKCPAVMQCHAQIKAFQIKFQRISNLLCNLNTTTKSRLPQVK